MEQEPQPQANAQGQGIWDNTTPYSAKVKFEFDKPVLVTFPSDFVRPKEMPGTNPDEKGFCVFEVKAGENQEDSVIMTSSMTMLRNLKTHMPLANKSLFITKKSVGGKTFYYVESAEQFKAREDATPKPDNTSEPKEVTADYVGINEQGEM